MKFGMSRPAPANLSVLLVTRDDALDEETAAEHAVVVADQSVPPIFRCAVERARRAGNREDVAVRVRRIADHVEVERVASADLAVSLAANKSRLIVSGTTEPIAGLPGESIVRMTVVSSLLVDAVVRAEEPQAILHDEPAQLDRRRPPGARCP